MMVGNLPTQHYAGLHSNAASSRRPSLTIWPENAPTPTPAVHPDAAAFTVLTSFRSDFSYFVIMSPASVFIPDMEKFMEPGTVSLVLLAHSR